MTSSTYIEGTAIDLVQVEAGPFLPAAVALDRSSSEAKYMHEINAGFARCVADMKADEVAPSMVDLYQYSFNEQVTLDAGPVLVRDFKPVTLTASGTTSLGAAINRILDDLEASEARYAYNGVRLKVPWLWVLTDAQPTDDISRAAARVRQLAAAGELNFLAVGVGDVDMNMLAAICPPNQRPKLLNDTKFSEFFDYMSKAMQQGSRIIGNANSSAQQLPPTHSWEVR